MTTKLYPGWHLRGLAFWYLKGQGHGGHNQTPGRVLKSKAMN
jgi:hypothetical protein